MTSELKRTNRSMATRLLRVVFGLYLVVVIGAMIGQMVVEYKYQKNSIRGEFLNIQATFEHVLAGQIWNLDEKGLQSTVEGMIELPVIVGMKIEDENGKITAIGGIVKNGTGQGDTGIHVHLPGCDPGELQIHRGQACRFEIFEGTFPIVHTGAKENRVLGRATIYSSTSVILNRVIASYLMLGVKALVEIGLLWLIFNMVFVRMLKKPLAELTSAVECVTLDNLDSIKVSVHSGYRDELGVLAESFNQMLLNLRTEIKKHKIADESLAASEAKLNGILRAAPAGVGLIKGGIFESVNPAMCDLTGYGREELLGHQTRLLYLTEEEYMRGGGRLATLVARHGIGMVEAAWQRKDGRRIDVLLSAAALNSNEPEGEITFIAINITDRTQAEAALAAEKERLAVTLRSIGDGVITTDTRGNVVIINKVAEKLTGWQSSEAHGMPLATVFRVINEETRQPCENPAEKVLTTGSMIELANHTVLVSKDGTERIIADSGAPIMDQSGATIGVVLVFRDMTEKQKLLDALQRADKLDSLGILAGGIAHDFNNMLAGIFGYIDLARERTNDSTIAECLDKSIGVFNRAKDLTQQLITFSKGGTPHRKTTELGPLIRACVSFALSGSNVSCEYDIDKDLFLADFDKNQIGQVIDNLVINAQQAMPLGGRIVISAKNAVIQEGDNPLLKAGLHIKMSITDTGIGIPADLLNRIFDPFFTTKQKGHGLGLATCYAIIQRHDGCIEVESTMGKGTTFHVYLPALQQEPLPPVSPLSVAHKGGGRILIMDDQPPIRDILGRFLKGMGYTTLEAVNGEEAVRLCAEAAQKGAPIDGAFLDLTIPGGMGGKEAVLQLRKQYPTIPIYAISGYSENPIMANPAEYGFTDCLHKPYRKDELAALLNRHPPKKTGA